MPNSPQWLSNMNKITKGYEEETKTWFAYYICVKNLDGQEFGFADSKISQEDALEKLALKLAIRLQNIAGALMEIIP